MKNETKLSSSRPTTRNERIKKKMKKKTTTRWKRNIFGKIKRARAYTDTLTIIHIVVKLFTKNILAHAISIRPRAGGRERCESQ